MINRLRSYRNGVHGAFFLGVADHIESLESENERLVLAQKARGNRNIYVASSWRNNMQPGIIEALRMDGHLVYDFKNPRPGYFGFNWSEIDPGWQQWTPEEYRIALDHPIAKQGFASDFDAMKLADTFVLVLPCGRSAHFELGWACGQGKQTLILLDQMEPELMVKMVDHICVDLDELRTVLSG